MARKPFDPSLIKPPPDDRDAPPRGPLSVSQLTALIKGAIETALPATVHVAGQLSNFKRHSSGHLYFTLKDAHSELSCVMWRSQATGLKFTPDDGLEVLATGRIDVYERSGRYQLYVRKIEPRGVGALELAFRQLCEKLEKEGLFDPDRKKPLPRFPRRIAIVTSPTGAAIADILRTLQRRFPCVEVLLYPVRVQGEAAGSEIARAIRQANRFGAPESRIDLLIVGRGGGSLEDLWAFNEECVARAIFASLIPVISAVGHETDVTVADLVADVRAATPTAAAELAVPVRDELLADLDAMVERLRRGPLAKLALARARFQGTSDRSSLADPMLAVAKREQAIDELAARVQRCLGDRIIRERRTVDRLDAILQRIAPHRFVARTAMRLQDLHFRLEKRFARRLHMLLGRADALEGRLQRTGPASRLGGLLTETMGLERRMQQGIAHRAQLAEEFLRRNEQRLDAMSHVSVLRRGFSITRHKKGGQVVRSTQDLRDRQRLVTELAEGEVESEVVNLRQLELFE
ncbi:MAG: exodeoxyribonuclease VII large subunit [Phycisphaerae bacterium]